MIGKVKVRYAGSVWYGANVVTLLSDLAPECGYDARVLARLLRLSDRHLRRIFAATLGCAPSHWLREQRLTAAWHRLQQAESVKEVAYGLGYRNLSQFSRDFRARFDSLPSALLAGARC